MKFFAAYDLQTDPNDLANSPVNWCVRKELEGGDSVPIIEIYPDPFDVQDQESPAHDQEYKDAEQVAEVCAVALNAAFGGDLALANHMHQALDALSAEFIADQKVMPTKVSLFELMKWSHARVERLKREQG